MFQLLLILSALSLALAQTGYEGNENLFIGLKKFNYFILS